MNGTKRDGLGRTQEPTLRELAAGIFTAFVLCVLLALATGAVIEIYAASHAPAPDIKSIAARNLPWDPYLPPYREPSTGAYTYAAEPPGAAACPLLCYNYCLKRGACHCREQRGRK